MAQRERLKVFMRTALITGAGTGIGRAAALRLSKDGFAIALVGRRAQPLERVAEEIQQHGGKTLAIAGDVTQLDQVESIVHRTTEAFGRIDLLLNNAGAAPRVPLAQLTAQQWQETLAVNLSAAFYVTRTVWPIMVRQHKSPLTHAREESPSARKSTAEGGIIVNVSSMASRDPFSGLGAYAAAKAGLNMLTLVTAREGHDVGIRAISIAPAAVETAMFRGVVGEEQVPGDIIMQPDDVAQIIADAVSGSLRFCSGETIFVHRRPA
jgi:NAD(P)-dependent dehydrogenase (short-subunit alcohol dehydrogenase family)